MDIPPEFTNKLKNSKLEDICRICILQKKSLRDIHKTRIPKMIENCASVKVSANDGLPQKICFSCFRIIVNFNSFKRKIERNDGILRDFLANKHKAIEQKDIINIALESADIKDVYQTDVEKPNLKFEYSLKQNNSSQIEVFTECIPPLIPLTCKEKVILHENVSRNLSNDPPPLVPIKQAVDIERLAIVASELGYKCYICSKSFKDMVALKKHKLDKCKPKNLQCNVCLKKFVEPQKLIGHLKGHMVVKDHMCKLCGKKYPNYSTFIIHMRSHTGERPFKCQICEKGFVRWASVRLHMLSHEDHRPYKCDMCPKAFKVNSNLERHKKIHYGIEPYRCSYCQKSYSQRENLRIHIRTNHTNERPFLCNICGKSFVNSTRLNRHMWIHSGKKPHICQLCPKSYSNRIDLKNHEVHHMGKNVNDLKNYSCDKCSKKFFHPCRLAKHKSVHEKKQKCHVCKKALDTKELYRHHLRDHHGFDECEDQFMVQFEEVIISANGNVTDNELFLT